VPTFTGLNCEVPTQAPLDLCTPNPCQNSGKCVQSPTSYATSCRCRTGFTGYLCQYSDPCTSSPCLNSATCYPSFGPAITYQCSCPAGFQGINCQIDSSTTCTPQTCRNAGACLIHPDTKKAYCACSVFYTGANCETSYNPCFTTDGLPVCQNSASCSINFGVAPYFQCSCRYGSTGSLCQQVVTTTRLTTLKTDQAVCQDLDTDLCKLYAANGYCSNLFLVNSISVPKYCGISCGVCGASGVTVEGSTTARPRCVDSQASCVFWGSTGNCGMLPDPTICSKSCGLCN